MPAANRRPDVSIVTSGHDVADARLHREVRALLAVGLKVELIGLGDPGAAPADLAGVATRERSSMVSRAGRAVAWPWRARGRVLLLLDPDTLPSALLWRAVRRRVVVADVHEDYVALLSDRSWVPARLRPALTRLASWCVGLAGRADLTVVADDHVPPLGGRCRDRLVVRNLPDLGLLPEPRAAAAVRRRAVYVGDVRRSRGMDAMVEAVAAAPEWQLDLVGPISASERNRLDELLERLAVEDRVRLHGRLEPQAAWKVAGEADVGLALLEDTPAFRDAVPTKVYEYLACGLAVVATPLPRVRDLLEAAGAGALVEDGPAAGDVLRGWSGDVAALVRRRAAATAWARTLDPAPMQELAAQVSRLSRG